MVVVVVVVVGRWRQPSPYVIRLCASGLPASHAGGSDDGDGDIEECLTNAVCLSVDHSACLTVGLCVSECVHAISGLSSHRQRSA